jgi:citrate lyase beta subunit
MTRGVAAARAVWTRIPVRERLHFAVRTPETDMPSVLNVETTRALLAPLDEASRRIAEHYPGDRLDRQPVHTVYGGAHLFASDVAQKLADAARRAFETYAPDAATFAKALGLPGDAAFHRTVHERVAAKLRREAVEDYRIDFEDGYGNRAEIEEDAQAEANAKETALGASQLTLPPAIGIRVKPLTDELRSRSLRTLDIYVSTLARASGGRLPENFVVTLPKITSSEQVAVFVAALETLERELKLPAGRIPIELMIETPQSIFAPDGRVALPSLIAAGKGRVRGAHFGTYDYTAGCSITARWQQPQHPACDFARHVMQVSLAGTGVWLSDGATTVMPVGPYKPSAAGALPRDQEEENRRAVHRAWRTHYDDVRSSLRHAYYQGWDLHPAQLPTRYAAVFSFFLESRDEAAARLKAFVEKAAQATLVGSIFDDAATGQGLLNFFLRGLSCGALTEDEALASGLTLEELRSRSFVKILNRRRTKG